jgi:hypothetical protein
MAGDWIKFEISTSEKPEVWAMAQALGIDADAVVGKLLRVWAWFDQQTPDGNAASVTTSVTSALPSRYQGVTSGVTKALLDRRVSVTGFCDAMISVGWMIESEGVVSLPNFDRHNGKTAKTRGLTAKRVASHKAKSNATSVTSSVSDALPREEKRREEVNTPLPPQGEPSKPSKRKPKTTEGQWIIPQGMNQSKILEALGHFEEMRKSKGKPIANRENLSRIFPSFDDEAHLLYAITFATANEYQGIKVDYRPPLQPGLPFGQDLRRKPLEVRPERCFK